MVLDSTLQITYRFERSQFLEPALRRPIALEDVLGLGLRSFSTSLRDSSVLLELQSLLCI